jgi:hypothetical protein
MRGAIPPLPQYTFMAWYSVKRKGTGIILPLPYYGGNTNACTFFSADTALKLAAWKTEKVMES